MIVTIAEPIEPGDVARLCVRVRSAMERRAEGVLVCDVARVDHPDATTLDVLARLALVSHRLGWRMCVRGAPPFLVGLLTLTGLESVAALGGEMERQPE